MDFFLHYRNPNFHSSSLVITNNKNTTSFHGKEGEKKMRNNKMSTKVVKLSTDPQSVAARERRHRISERFKILRSLIPGGDTRNMDTVSMLEEAIQYVKYLQSQILLHQTMISFENLDHYAEYPHDQDLHPFDHFYGDHHHHEMLPQLGFAEGPSLKVEGDDNLLNGHHHHAMYS